VYSKYTKGQQGRKGGGCNQKGFIPVVGVEKKGGGKREEVSGVRRVLRGNGGSTRTHLRPFLADGEDKGPSTSCPLITSKAIKTWKPRQGGLMMEKNNGVFGLRPARGSYLQIGWYQGKRGCPGKKKGGKKRPLGGKTQRGEKKNGGEKKGRISHKKGLLCRGTKGERQF